MKLGGVRVAEVIIAETDQLSRIIFYDNNGDNLVLTDFETLNLLSCQSYRYCLW